jgi:biopolymer transport protein ExbB/TolQ
VSKFNSLSAALLRSPLLWGGALAFAFFSLIHGGVITDANVIRYLAGHWVEYVEVTLFCIGIASLALRAVDLVAQQRRLATPLLDPIPAGGDDPAAATDLVATLPPEDGYLPRRLRDALDLVVRTGSADGLEDHLKYLSDVDAARASQGYGLVRFIVWAIPIMGFLGTVIGITVAIASLSPTQLENISGVVAGLGTAFDTTATALGLSMVLMFLQFVLDRYEQGLLGRVDEAAWGALAGRFQSVGEGESTALAMARLGDAMAQGTGRLIESQEEAWRALERTASEGIRQLVAQGSEAFSRSLATTLDHSLGAWAASLASAHDQAAARREDRWTAAAETLAMAVQRLDRHQDTLGRQAELLTGVVEATRDIATLERTLEANLTVLSATGRFEETLTTLAAAVHLLSARTMARGLDEIESARSSGKAA